MKRKQILLSALAIVCFSCSYSTYEISTDSVSHSFRKIEHFSISQYHRDNENLEDVRPNDRTELTRYCCELKQDGIAMNTVFFDDTINYLWRLCKLDTSIVVNDSLNSLTLSQKLDYVEKMEEYDRLYNPTRFGTPFKIENGFVYKIFGLPRLAGSYYFYIDSLGKLIVQYHNEGPW